MRCLLKGHCKEYVSITIKSINGERCTDVNCCAVDYHKIKIIYSARYICRHCKKQGIDIKKRGAWKIDHGALVPDNKAWANGEGR